MKHRHGLVTDCHHLPMVPIVPQSAPMVSVADVSVKLYIRGCTCVNSHSLYPPFAHALFKCSINLRIIITMIIIASSTIPCKHDFLIYFVHFWQMTVEQLYVVFFQVCCSLCCAYSWNVG